MTIKTILATACLLVSSMSMGAQTSSFLGYRATIDGQKYIAKDITVGENTIKLKGTDDTYKSLDVTHGTEVELPMAKDYLYCVAGTLTADLIKEAAAANAVWGGAINQSDISEMDENLSGQKSFTFANLNVSTTAISYMFDSATDLETVDFAGKTFEGATLAFGVFHGCSSLKEIDLSGTKLTNVTGASNFFFGCSSLQSANLSGGILSKAQYMPNMFYGCSSLKTIDFSGWDSSYLATYNNFFYGCSSLTTIKAVGCSDATISFLNARLSDAGLADQVTIITTE